MWLPLQLFPTTCCCPDANWPTVVVVALKLKLALTPMPIVQMPSGSQNFCANLEPLGMLLRRRRYHGIASSAGARAHAWHGTLWPGFPQPGSEGGGEQVRGGLCKFGGQFGPRGRGGGLFCFESKSAYGANSEDVCALTLRALF